MDNVTVVLPSLNPDEKLNQVVDGLIEKGFKDIVVVNDGSAPEYLEPFKRAAMHPEVTVLTHEVNKGKGRGLKTAFEFVLKERPNSPGVVTVDGDNQHKPADIKNCAERMLREKDKVVLGTRDFDNPGVPAKSKLGNKITRKVFRIFCGMKITDTQTGLRAIPREYLELLINTKGERYEFETEMFFALYRAHIEWVEEEIETVYIEDNASSHFNPIRDSIRIYKIILRFIFKYTLSSLTCCVIDIGAFNLFNIWFRNVDAFSQNTNFFGNLITGKSGEYALGVFVATIIARVISSIVNYIINRRAVFESSVSVKQSVWKYYILCVVQMIFAAIGVMLMIRIFGNGEALEGLVYKPVVDVILFFVSYRIQQRWVFR